MKRFVLLPIFAGLLVAKPAEAVAIFAGGRPVMVHEDFVLLHHDAATKRVHVLFAARVSPAFRRVQLGYPTPSEPTIEHVVLDLPAALHKLIAPHEMRAGKRASAPPAPWAPEGARLDGYVERPDASDRVFDASWTKSYVDKGYFVAVADVTTPEDGRLEVSSPAAHISFTSERLVFPRREPPLAIGVDDGSSVDLPDKPRQPVTVLVEKLEPKLAGVTTEGLGKMLGDHPGPLLSCYETFLEKKPNETLTLHFALTIRPKGDVVTLKEMGSGEDPASNELGSCVKKVLRAKQLVRANEGYEFRTAVTFSPPRIPARRTHILTIGSSKYVWRNVPAAARLEEDFEILPTDVNLALSSGIRKAIGLREGERIWVSHWVDRNERRVSAEDIEFEAQELPAVEEARAAAAEVHDADRQRGIKAQNVLAGQTNSRKRRNTVVMLGMLVLGLAAALGIVGKEMRQQ